MLGGAPILCHSGTARTVPNTASFNSRCWAVHPCPSGTAGTVPNTASFNSRCWAVHLSYALAVPPGLSPTRRHSTRGAGRYTHALAVLLGLSQHCVIQLAVLGGAPILCPSGTARTVPNTASFNSRCWAVHPCPSGTAGTVPNTASFNSRCWAVHLSYALAVPPGLSPTRRHSNRGAGRYTHALAVLPGLSPTRRHSTRGAGRCTYPMP